MRPLLRLLLTFTLLATLWPGRVDSAEPGLADLARPHGVAIGALVDLEPLQNDPAYRDALLHDFDLVMPLNVLKFKPLRPTRDTFDFADGDVIVDFANAHGLDVRVQSIIWHNQLPGWLTQTTWSRDELIEIMREHITTLVGHYRGRVDAWVVVNEALELDGSWRRSIWYDTIGPEYVDLAFEFARAADPDALLFYNDFRGEGLSEKSNYIYEFVRDLRARGVPVDGVGLQMHVQGHVYPNPVNVEANIRRLGELGVQVHITEMDVRILQMPGDRATKLAAQADVYRAMLEVCLRQEACTAFSLWGFSDAHSWVYNHFGGRYPNEAPLLLDVDYRPKPAYHALHAVLRHWPTSPEAATAAALSDRRPADAARNLLRSRFLVK